MRKDGKTILYCKGADSKIKERLDPSEKTIMSQTDEHLNVNFCSSPSFFDLGSSQKFATDGLRTLCLAYKELNESDYNRWAEKLSKAK